MERLILSAAAVLILALTLSFCVPYAPDSMSARNCAGCGCQDCKQRCTIGLFGLVYSKNAYQEQTGGSGKRLLVSSKRCYA
jgi:hypothetical protein